MHLRDAAAACVEVQRVIQKLKVTHTAAVLGALTTVGTALSKCNERKNTNRSKRLMFCIAQPTTITSLLSALLVV